MKIKQFIAAYESQLKNDVWKFIKNPDIKILTVEYSPCLYIGVPAVGHYVPVYSAAVAYEE